MIRKTSLTLLLLLTPLAMSAREEYTRVFDKSVSVPIGEKIWIEHKFGDIVIHGRPQQNVVVHADIRISASDSSRAKQYADQVEILVQPGSGLAIRTRYPDVQRYFGGHDVSFSVRYDITVPESSPLSVRNSFGTISAEGVKTPSEIYNSHGELRFRDGRGAQRLENSFASVKVSGNIGDVIVEGTNGSVEAAGITGGVTIRNRFASVNVAQVSNGVSITNNNGSVSVTDCGGAGYVKNSFGTVTVRNFRGDLTVAGGYGQLEVDNVSGSVDLKNGFGRVLAEGVAGAMQIRNQNGSIDAFSSSRAGCKPITLHTSFSSLRVHLPPDASYHVYAKTSFSHVRSDFPLTVSGALGEGEVNGSLGSGQCEMRLTNNNGAIEILKANP